MKKNNYKKYEIEVRGYPSAKILALGPVLYYLRDFDKEYELYSIYWKVNYRGRIFLIDTGIKDIDYINSTVKGSFMWERIEDIKKFDCIDYIFPTHLHYDHASGIYDYKDSKIIINNKTYNNLVNDRYDVLFEEKIYRKDILKRVRNKDSAVIHKDGEEIVKGVKTFWVGGHSPCSQIITFDVSHWGKGKKSKSILFAGDIIPTYKNLKEKIPGGYNYNLMEYFDFFNNYLNGKFVIIPGHDKKALELYGDLKI